MDTKEKELPLRPAPESYHTLIPKEKSTDSRSSKPVSIFDNESLLNACRKDDLELVSQLLQLGVDVNYHNPVNPMPARNITAMYGRLNILQLLLGEPGIRVNVRNYLGHTPLSLASWYGHIEVVEELLKHSGVFIDPTDN